MGGWRHQEVGGNGSDGRVHRLALGREGPHGHALGFQAAQAHQLHGWAVCCRRDDLSDLRTEKDGSVGGFPAPQGPQMPPGTLMDIQLRQRCTAYKSVPSGAPIPAQMLAVWRDS